MKPTDATKLPTDAGVAAALAAAAQQAISAVEVTEIDGKKLAFIDKTGNGGRELLDLSSHQARPPRLVQIITLSDAASFIGYVKLFGDRARTIVLGNRNLDEPRFTALFDYHTAGSHGQTESPDVPSWIGHRAHLKLETTDAWDDWTEKHEVEMSQIQFAQWLEDRIPDIAAPPAAGLIDIIRNFQMQKGVTFRSSVRASDSQVQVAYVEEITNGSTKDDTMMVPTEIVLGLTPFVGQEKIYRVTARLRWRVHEAKLLVKYSLVRPDDIFYAAFDEVRAEIAAAIKDSVKAELLGTI